MATGSERSAALRQRRTDALRAELYDLSAAHPEVQYRAVLQRLRPRALRELRLAILAEIDRMAGPVRTRPSTLAGGPPASA